jgi:stage V sporulation protein AD
MGIPFLGVYGACSTCTESLLVLSAMLDTSKNMRYGAAVTTSHNSAAERQFRTPIEYGGQRPLTSTWTATAGGAFILERGGDGPTVTELMPGKVIDGGTADGTNMGGSMSFAAAETILSYFEESGESLSSFDYIITGDLGKVGSDILKDILARELPSSERLHVDCGMLLYDLGSQDAHSGASGCGTSAAVMASHFLPLMLEGAVRDVLLLSTGALMNPGTLLQGQNIAGIAPLIRIKMKGSASAV